MSSSISDSIDAGSPCPAVAIPPLESGDRLTRSEFERRYNAMPRLKKAELVEGVVFLPSPVRYDVHGNPHAELLAWLGVYRAGTPGVLLADNTTVRIDADSVVQPDALMMIDARKGGQALIDADGYVAGAPEFVAEVAATTASLDLNAKFHVYRRSGVREYLVWRVVDTAVDWFVLRGGEFERLAEDDDGLMRSEVFPGLWLDAAALRKGNLAVVLDRLQSGLASPEHADFARQLQAPSE